MPEYKIIIENTEDLLEGSLNPVDIDETTNKKLKKKLRESREPAYDGSSIVKQIYKAQAVYGLLEPIANAAVQTVSQTNYLQGETLKAQRLDTAYSNLTQNVQLGFSLGVTLFTGNPIAIAATAYQLAQRAYQLGLETRRFTVEQNKNRYKQQYLSQRLVRTISEVR